MIWQDFWERNQQLSLPKSYGNYCWMRKIHHMGSRRNLWKKRRKNWLRPRQLNRSRSKGDVLVIIIMGHLWVDMARIETSI